MLNNVILSGKIKEIIEKGDETIVTLIVPNCFKNEDGKYDNNYINVKMFKQIAENIKEYCKEGELIGIKGRLKKLEKDNEMSVIAERATFLSGVLNKEE